MRVGGLCLVMVLVTGCVLAFPHPAAAMGGKPETPATAAPKADAVAAAPKDGAASATVKGRKEQAAADQIGGEMLALMEGSAAPQPIGGLLGGQVTAVMSDSDNAAPSLSPGGLLGGQVTAVMGDSGNAAPSLSPGGIAGGTGMGLPPMPAGGAEGALPSAGGMAPPSMDGFPPFFGDTGAQQPAAPRNAADAAQALLGTWSASSGQRVLHMVFRPGGVCAIIDNGRQVAGTYEVRDNQLHMRFANGKSLSLTCRVEGDFLVLSDGSRLRRQPDGRPQAGRQPMPQPSPQQPSPREPSPQAQAAQGLEGAWAAGSSQGMVIMMFMNGICGLNANGRQLYGPYTVQGNHLHVQFMNAKPLDVDFTVEGDILRFSDGTVLRRQQMPNMPGGGQPIRQQPMPGGPHQQPAQQPMPQQAGGATPLEGAWGAQLPNGVQLVFVFTGGQYRVLANGRPTETGVFTLNGDRLEYTTTSGQNPGQKGVNRWHINGDTLTMTLPDGTSLRFGRQPR